MVGCFGNSDYDRWLEKKALDHTDPDYYCEDCEAEEEDMCICEKDVDEQQSFSG